MVARSIGTAFEVTKQLYGQMISIRFFSQKKRDLIAK